MKAWRKLGLLGLCLFIFQNCGKFERPRNSKFYSYTTAPNFYHDIKLISVSLDSAGREEYVFDFAIAYAHDADQSITYQVAFSTLNFSGVCRTQERIADAETKHFRLSCKMPIEDVLFLQLTLLGPQGEEFVDQYQF